MAGELQLDRGLAVSIKRHYDYGFTPSTAGDGSFTVFAPAEVEAPRAGETGTLLLLRTMERLRVRIDAVETMGTEHRIVGRKLP